MVRRGCPHLADQRHVICRVRDDVDGRKWSRRPHTSPRAGHLAVRDDSAVVCPLRRCPMYLSKMLGLFISSHTSLQRSWLRSERSIVTLHARSSSMQHPSTIQIVHKTPRSPLSRGPAPQEMHPYISPTMPRTTCSALSVNTDIASE